MSVEEELKKDHSDMQAVVDSKQKIIDAQVSLLSHNMSSDSRILTPAVNAAYNRDDSFCLCFSHLYVLSLLFSAWGDKGSLKYKEMFNS